MSNLRLLAIDLDTGKRYLIDPATLQPAPGTTATFYQLGAVLQPVSASAMPFSTASTFYQLGAILLAV